MKQKNSPGLRLLGVRIQISTAMVYLVGGFNPSEKYENQIGSSPQVLGKVKNVPNHQPVYQQLKPPQPGFLLGGSLPHLAAMTAMTGPEPEHVL